MFGMYYELNLGVQELLILAAIGFLLVGGLVAVLFLVFRSRDREE